MADGLYKKLRNDFTWFHILWVGENTVWHKLSPIVFHTGNATFGQTMQTPDSPPLVHHRALHFIQYTFVCRSRNDLYWFVTSWPSEHIYIYISNFFFCFKCTPLPFVPPKPIPFLRGATKKKHHGATKEWMQLMSASPRGDRFRNEARTKAQLLWLRQQCLGT